MPGPVSDAYDPEWGTDQAADDIREALREEYKRVSGILGYKPPVFIGELIHMDQGPAISEALSERSWRLLRFALERAIESV
jgi:hypothetical protein